MNLVKTDIPAIPLLNRGKVRDIYDLGENLLIIATDRISAFDWILPTPIPGKGKILTSMSAFWFKKFENMVPNHLISTCFADFPEILRPFREQVEGRSMLVRKAKRIDVECVARGYLVGSGYKDYIELQPGPDGFVNLHGNPLPAGLKLAERLPQPIFTPATKEESGHDRNIGYSEMAGLVGSELAFRLRKITLDIYSAASEYALSKGIIIADTKFEFGLLGDELILIDEILSPDSSRFWPLSSYKVGSNPPSYDKQLVRDWLEQSGWDKQSPPPGLPDEIVGETLKIYREAHRLLVGKEID